MSKKKKKEQVYLPGAYTLDKKGNKISVSGVQEALSIVAEKCENCGCSDCYGFYTTINATTGELMAFYIVGDEGSYSMVVEPYDEAVINTKALKEARS